MEIVLAIYAVVAINFGLTLIACGVSLRQERKEVGS
jgi:hypothetical protein